MKVSAAALPTVRWKWAAIHAVLCTTELSTYAALIDPPNPPTMKRSPASSTDETTVNAVMRLGNEIAIVLKVWKSFHPAGIPGSWYWWWKPTGVEKMRKSAKVTRASGSEKSFPPASLGVSAY